MFYFLKILLLLINIDQEIVLKLFGIENPINTNSLIDNVNLSNIEVQPSSTISLGTFQLLVDGLWQRVKDGLTLGDIENLLFFILCIRFIVLVIRYNIKTSFYITCIGLVAGYLWYRHLIDLISMYRAVLIKIPYLHKLGVDAVQMRSMSRQMVLTDLRLGDNVHWYNPGQVIYYAFTRSIISTDTDTGLRYYIDPVSMFISTLNKSTQATVLPIYYKMYNNIIPQLFDSLSKFWGQLSGIAAYAVITRIGKRYCPYLVRWHWTFLLIIGFLEQIIIHFVYRITYFQAGVLIPQTEISGDYINPNIILQINALNGVIAAMIALHLGLIFFGLFHAIWGQYFYFPFIVENTELHIGQRPKNSIYSGGNTAWQDNKDKNLQRFFPKFWYGWFGSGTTGEFNLLKSFQRLLANIIKHLRV